MILLIKSDLFSFICYCLLRKKSYCTKNKHSPWLHWIVKGFYILKNFLNDSYFDSDASYSLPVQSYTTTKVHMGTFQPLHFFSFYCFCSLVVWILSAWIICSPNYNTFTVSWLCFYSPLPPFPSTPDSIPKKNTSFPPFTSPCVYISLLLLACWFSQFHQMIFLTSLKRKPRAS